jgi:hypothetical protein
MEPLHPLLLGIDFYQLIQIPYAIQIVLPMHYFFSGKRLDCTTHVYIYLI